MRTYLYEGQGVVDAWGLQGGVLFPPTKPPEPPLLADLARAPLRSPTTMPHARRISRPVLLTVLITVRAGPWPQTGKPYDH